MDRQDHQRLIDDQWKIIEKARTAYHQAEREFDRVKESGIEPLDGGSSMPAAEARRRDALQAYRKAVTRLHQLVLEGTALDEDLRMSSEPERHSSSLGFALNPLT